MLNPSRIQKLFQKQVALLLQNLRHPSLRAKKYDEARDIWQARVDRGWRFYFQIRGDTYYLLNLTPHP
jgi:mRNA interferase RelE/StbE